MNALFSSYTYSPLRWNSTAKPIWLAPSAAVSWIASRGRCPSWHGILGRGGSVRKYLFQGVKVFFISTACDKNVIIISDTNMRDILKDAFHHPLEYCQSRCNAKREAIVLIQACVCVDDGQFQLLPHPAESGYKHELCKWFSTCKWGQGVLYLWEWVEF